MVEYISQSPIIPLVLSGLLVLVILMQSLTRRRMALTKLLVSIFLTFASTALLVFFNEIKNTGNEIYLILTYVSMLLIELTVFVILFLSMDNIFSNESFQRELTKSLDETKYYVMLDRKDRVKEISTYFLNDLEIKASDAINKNFFDVLELKYRVIGMNGEGAFKKEIKKFYEHYEKKVKAGGKYTLELELEDEYAKTSAFYFNESVIFSSDKYRGRILIGEKKSEEVLMGLEKQEKIARNELDLVKDRFESLLKNSTDGIFFNTLTKDSMWVNDVLMRRLRLDSHTISSTEFYNRVSDKDKEYYRQYLANMKDGDYELKYSFNLGANDYVDIEEVGSRISNDELIELCGIMKISDNDGYEVTQTKLDLVKTERELNRLLYDLNREEKVYEVCYIKIESIPDINEKFSRSIGNLCLAEFVDRFKLNYLPEGTIYRIGGLEFVAVILNYNKMETLKSQLNDNEKPLHLIMNYGGEKINIDAIMGICMSNEGRKEDIVKFAKSAMNYASDDKYMASYCNFKDMRRWKILKEIKL